MSDLREPYAGTAFAGLEWTPDVEKAIDRVAAGSAALRLGVNLWRAKYLLEAQAYHDVIDGMVRRYLERYDKEKPEVARKLVEQVFSEFMGPQCKDCGGSKELIIDQQLKLCPTCDGSGLRRYSDYHRATCMQIERRSVERRSTRMRWIYDQLGTMDGEVNYKLSIELERLRLA